MRRFPFRPAALALAAAAALAGCSGVSGMDRARAMTPGEIAQKPDDFVCERLRSFGYIGDLPDAWLLEAQNRRLEHCIDQGVARRRAESTDRGRYGCDRFAVGPVNRCQ